VEGHEIHQNINLLSSDEEPQEINSNHLEEEFQVYTVEDAVRRIEEETRQMIQNSGWKKSSAPNQGPSAIKADSKPPALTPRIEESKNTPTKRDKRPNFIEDNSSKHKVPIAKMKLDSVTFSDIVNYESNDDLVSLTGDRKFKVSNHLSNKLSSNKSSTIGQRPQATNYALEQQMAPEIDYNQKFKETVVESSNEKNINLLTFSNHKIGQVKRDSDMVNVGDSSVLTSQATNFGMNRNFEESKREHSNQSSQKKTNYYVPRANINMNLSNNTHQKSNIQQNTPQRDTKRTEENIVTMLNRISEELGLSGDTIVSKSIKKEKINEKKTLEIQDSYNDYAVFEDPEAPENQLYNSSSSKRNSPKKKDSSEKKIPSTNKTTHRAIEKSNEAKRIEKLKQKRALEKKLKELEELEKLVQQKEQSKRAKKRAILTIQRWVRGHLTRKEIQGIKNNAWYIRKLRRMLSVAIKKMQTKFVKSLIYQLQKWGKEKHIKLLKLQVEGASHKKSKNYEPLLEDNHITPVKAKTFYKRSSNMISDRVNEKIIAFVRGWKIRKIMKWSEIIEIIKRSNDVSISIKLSQYNPQNNNFIREFLDQKRQIVERFLFTIKKLYHTGAWTKTYKLEDTEKSGKKVFYNPNVVVNLSMPTDVKQNLIQSTSTIRPPMMHLNSICSQIVAYNQPNSHMNNPNRDFMFGKNAYAPPAQYQTSPFRNQGYNPFQKDNPNFFTPINQNMRYALPVGMSVTDGGRPSDAEALKLVNQVLNSGSPISNRLSSFQNPPSQRPIPQNVVKTPVVPEIQQPIKSEMRETVEFPSQHNASITTFTPINVDDIPIKSQNDFQPIINNSPGKIEEVANSTLTSIEPPKYDFEEILKKALQEQGIDSKLENKKQKPSVQKKKKATFLKKKKRYDPKEAIKKEKQQRNSRSKCLILESKSKYKSALPKELLKNKQESENESDQHSESEENEVEEQLMRQIKTKPKQVILRPKDPNDSDDEEQQSKDDNNEDQEGEGDNEDDPETKKNCKPKPFLKRKTRAVKFQKLNWNNVKSKTDWWTKRSARSEHRDKSVSKVNKSQIAKPNKQQEKEKSKPKVGNKTFNNIQSRIDTGIRKAQRRIGSEDSNKDSFEYHNHYNLGEYANENTNPLANQKSAFVKNNLNFPPVIDVRRYQLNHHQIDNSNVNYEVFSSGDDLNPHQDDEFNYNQMQNQYVQNPENYTNIYNQSPSEDQFDQEDIPNGKKKRLQFSTKK
jgi:hypothetical protein